METKLPSLDTKEQALDVKLKAVCDQTSNTSGNVSDYSQGSSSCVRISREYILGSADLNTGSNSTSQQIVDAYANEAESVRQKLSPVQAHWLDIGERVGILISRVKTWLIS